MSYATFLFYATFYPIEHFDGEKAKLDSGKRTNKAAMADKKKIERRKKLLSYIAGDPGILMRDLAVKLDVSRETIRRDF